MFGKLLQVFACSFVILQMAPVSAQIAESTVSSRTAESSIMSAERDSTTTRSDRLTTESRLQRAPRRPAPPPGKVWPTAANSLGGATSHTQSMPTDVEGLIEMRRPFQNRPEFRGAWVTRFDWTRGRQRGAGEKVDVEAIKARITEIMENAKRLNLNAILFQIRGDATTLYPSKLEPWSQLLGGSDPGFDPVKFAVEQAHKNGLEFHAYMNPIPCSEERTTTPANKDHVFYKHCLPDSQPNWLVFKDGAVAPFNEYKWFNPNLPEVQKYLRDVILDAVTRYDFDGVHYDRIRLPSPDVSDDPWSKERYKNANPNKLQYNEWQADNITRMLTDIYGAIMEVKPKMKVSAAVWGIYDNDVLPPGTDRATGYSWTSNGLKDFMQDSVGWTNRGCMDALVPMIYWSMGDMKPDYDELLLTFVSGIHNGRHVYGGQSVFSKEEMLRQVIATNLIGGQGTVPFTLGGLSRPEMAEFYVKNIYPSPAPVPEMAWKTRPVYGHVLVTVKGSDGKPVTDALVTVSGKKENALSGTDGFCAILDVAPGSVEVTAQKSGAQSESATATVQAGKTVRVELALK